MLRGSEVLIGLGRSCLSPGFWSLCYVKLPSCCWQLCKDYESTFQNVKLFMSKTVIFVILIYSLFWKLSCISLNVPCQNSLVWVLCSLKKKNSISYAVFTSEINNTFIYLSIFNSFMCKVSHFRLYILSISERFSEKMGRHAHTQMCAHTHTHFVTCGFISKGKLVKKKSLKKLRFF